MRVRSHATCKHIFTQAATYAHAQSSTGSGGCVPRLRALGGLRWLCLACLHCSISTVKATVVPTMYRSTVTSLLRLPVNIVTIAVIMNSKVCAHGRVPLCAQWCWWARRSTVRFPSNAPSWLLLWVLFLTAAGRASSPGAVLAGPVRWRIRHQQSDDARSREVGELPARRHCCSVTAAL